MATILLDSSVIFDHLNGRFGRTQFLDQLVEQGHVLACCPVNFTEVYAGLRPGEEDKTAAFLNSLEYLPVTPEIARQAGLLRRDWQKKGQTLSYTDVTIAAVALSGEVPLLTDNRKHFPMPELQLLPLPDRAG
jgi:predicted nucleic acid-binding protein